MAGTVRSSNRDHIKEEGGEGSFPILETGSNFQMLLQGEDGRLAIDRKAVLLGHRERQM